MISSARHERWARHSTSESTDTSKANYEIVLLDLWQIKLQPRQNERSEFAFFNATVQFVATFFERENLEGLLAGSLEVK